MLKGKTILITGAARRIGASLALYLAKSGADIILHHAHSPEAAEQTAAEIRETGRQAWVIRYDFKDPGAASRLIDQAWNLQPFDALINNAAIFEDFGWKETTVEVWKSTMDINLTAPFFLSQQFSIKLDGKSGRIINILDWRGLRPGADHLAYTVSKGALVTLTQSLAQALAPNITVNGLALGAILAPSDGNTVNSILNKIPAGRWADLSEVGHAAAFLLTGPAYITGEIIHIDGGRHLV